MMDGLRRFFLPLVYARRGLRAGIKGFYVFLACLILGVGAIAGVQSLARGLLDSLHHDGRYILGGDVALRTIYAPATPEQVKFLHDKMGPITVVMETRAMARRPDEKRASLVELKAVDPFYPLYGKLEIVDEKGEKIEVTDEKGRVSKMPLQDLILPPPTVNGVERDEWGALAEKELLTRLNLHLGDWVSVGQQKFQLRGILAKEPDRIGSTRFSLAPRLMISSYTFARTGLKQLGSQVYYDHKILMPYLKSFDDLKAAEQKIKAQFPEASWQMRDFLSAAPQVERLIKRLTMFLTLIGLATLLIGGVGISNAVRAFLESRFSDIATLKCLGAAEKFVFRAYMLQIFALAALGVAAGVGLGAAAAKGAGILLTARLALSDEVSLYPAALALAAAFGLLTAFCFSLWPMGRAVRVSPSDLFRDLISPAAKKPGFDVLLWILIAAQGLALLALFSFSDRRLVEFFVAGAALAFAVFYSYAAAVKGVLRRLRLPAAPELRLALANLHRPGNISSSIVLSLGLGLTVLVAVALVQYNFQRLIRDDVAADAPSFFFLDIEPGQREAFRAFIAAEPSARSLSMMPSFRGRVVAVNGRKAEEALADPNESWVINSDRGFTYAAELPAYSRVVAGEWWPGDYKGPPLVSIATNVARAFNIGVGDAITVNIFGTDITARVGNVREIDWASFTMNFAITFAPGLLEKIPANYLATAIVARDREEALQTALANRFQNITCVRVRDALEAAQTMVRAVAQAVGISAGVTLLAGTLVLAGGIAAARRRHLYDAVILKVLGATQARILSTFLLEYALLGLLTAAIAAALGTAAAWGVQQFIMDISWKFSAAAVLGVTALCLAITLAAGILGTWRALRQKPALYLRNQ